MTSQTKLNDWVIRLIKFGVGGKNFFQFLKGDMIQKEKSTIALTLLICSNQAVVLFQESSKVMCVFY